MKSRLLKLVSIISWLWGLVLFLTLLSIAYPFYVENQLTGGLLFFLSVMSIIAIFVCISGFGLWKQKRPFNKIAIFSFILCVIYGLFFQSLISYLTIAIGTIILISVLIKWKAFL